MDLKTKVLSLSIPSNFKVAIAQAVLKIDEIAKELNIHSLYLFGSCARGEALPGSDIDLLLITSGTERSVYESPMFWGIDDDTSDPPVQLTVRKLDLLLDSPSNCDFNNAIKKDLVLLRRYKNEC